MNDKLDSAAAILSSRQDFTTCLERHEAHKLDRSEFMYSEMQAAQECSENLRNAMNEISANAKKEMSLIDCGINASEQKKLEHEIGNNQSTYDRLEDLRHRMDQENTDRHVRIEDRRQISTHFSHDTQNMTDLYRKCMELRDILGLEDQTYIRN